MANTGSKNAAMKYPNVPERPANKNLGLFSKSNAAI